MFKYILNKSIYFDVVRCKRKLLPKSYAPLPVPCRKLLEKSLSILTIMNIKHGGNF